MNNKEVITPTLKTTFIDPSLVYTDYFSNTISTPCGIVTKIIDAIIHGNNICEKYGKIIFL